MAGEITLNPGTTLTDPITLAKLQAALALTAVLNDNSIGDAKIISMSVAKLLSGVITGKSVTLAHTGSTEAVLKSEDFAQGLFFDGTGTTGSTTFASATAAFTNADLGRVLGGYSAGIPNGTAIAAIINGTTVTLNQALQIDIEDAVINGTTTLTSASAAFSVADVGRTITGYGIPAGTTIAAYVSATQVTLSAAATVSATGVTININGRPLTLIFLIIGRGRGWALHAAPSGTGFIEDYNGAQSGVIAVGSLLISGLGRMDIGTAPNAMTVLPNGDASWGSKGRKTAILHDGTSFWGGADFASAVVRIDGNGDIRILNTAGSNHLIDFGAIDIGAFNASQPVITPAGGAFNTSAQVSLNHATQGTKIYYRATPPDGVTNTDTSFVSAGGNFTAADVGKAITGTDIPAGTTIASVTNSTTLVLSQATTGSHTGVSYAITPNTTDTLYAGPLSLTSSKTIAARAYKLGEFSTMASATFTNDAGTVSNPRMSPIGGPWTTTDGTLEITLESDTPGASIRYTTDGTSPSSSAGTLISPADSVTPPKGTFSITGSKTVKAIAYKSALSDSGVVSQAYAVTIGGNPPSTGGGGGGGGGRSRPILPY